MLKSIIILQKYYSMFIIDALVRSGVDSNSFKKKTTDFGATANKQLLMSYSLPLRTHLSTLNGRKSLKSINDQIQYSTTNVPIMWVDYNHEAPFPRLTQRNWKGQIKPSDWNEDDNNICRGI